MFDFAVLDFGEFLNSDVNEDTNKGSTDTYGKEDEPPGKALAGDEWPTTTQSLFHQQIILTDVIV